MKQILLIGDSICLDYGKYINEYTDKNIHIYGKPGREQAYVNLDIPVGGNGGDSSAVLEWITDPENEAYLKCDYFFFNAGLHDIRHNAPTFEFQVSVEEYADNLKKIIDFMTRRKIPVVFINTTPADGRRYAGISEFIRRTEDVPVYNLAAEKVCAEKNIPIVDLFSFTGALNLFGSILVTINTIEGVSSTTTVI